MKKLLIINLVFSIIFIICSWTFALCTHGAIVSSIGFVAGPLCGFAMILLFLVIPVLFIINFYYVFKFWDDYKLITFLPFLMIGLAVISIGFWDVGALSIKRFERYQPDYETFVGKLVGEHKQGEWDNIKMPPKYKHLAHWATVYDNEPNNIFASFMVGYFGTFGHTSILYSSKGEITPDSYTDKSWLNKQRINKHWFRVSD